MGNQDNLYSFPLTCVVGPSGSGGGFASPLLGAWWMINDESNLQVETVVVVATSGVGGGFRVER